MGGQALNLFFTKVFLHHICIFLCVSDWAAVEEQSELLGTDAHDPTPQQEGLAGAGCLMGTPSLFAVHISRLSKQSLVTLSFRLSGAWGVNPVAGSAGCEARTAGQC